MMVDPRVYPTVEGDTDEYNVFVRQFPDKMDSAAMKVSGPFDTEEQAKAAIDEVRDTTFALWDRYERYLKLKMLRANTELDYAEKPKWSREQVAGAWVAPSAKMSTKRLGMPYFAGLRPDSSLEVYTFTPEDFCSDDWRVA